MSKWRTQLMQVGQTGKVLLGVSMLLIAVLVFTGADKAFEAWLVDLSPSWLTDLTTKY
jgi:hypothetical protein